MSSHVHQFVRRELAGMCPRATADELAKLIYARMRSKYLDMLMPGYDWCSSVRRTMPAPGRAFRVDPETGVMREI